MSNESLLQTLLDHDVFAEEEQMVSGIARNAIDNGYNSLSGPQKRVLEPFMSQTCDGVEDPGGYHNDCRRVMTDDELQTAYENQGYYDALLCSDCINEYESYEAARGRLDAE
ncbi:hypothetical protein CHU32_03655 [Superficieibacter electus]|uniref:Uncharacterized protein n=1 Tax=Superficieibacter electus TaxID=2022662 RepID=A0A2P5GVE9_9ENTR|nr:hypothetical protein [Superficieibacter electus]POP42342.1 hypothetical protein CHU33_19940 [Superficieibacter electus]POP50530.1 hypothetical protein CHU32_03655 [Superficieibacter electus]